MKRESAIYLTCLIMSCFSMSSASLYSQDVRVSAKPDTTAILIGDQIWFTVTVDKPGGLILNHLRLRDTLVNKIEILQGPVSDTLSSSDNRVVIRDRYLITSFDSGRYEIPPFYAEMVSDEGVKRFYSEYSYLSVKRSDIAPQDTTMHFFDIIPPYKAPITIGELLPWFLAVIALAAIAYFVVKYFMNRKKESDEVIADDVVEAAHILAYRNLEKLKGEKLWQKGEYKEYYTRLSDIVRVYIDMRFSMNSMESTTGEIMDEISVFEVVEGEPADSLRQVLELADMVKFAKFKPDSSDCELSMEQAWSFISMTRKEKAVVKNEEAVDEEKGGEE